MRTRALVVVLLSSAACSSVTAPTEDAAASGGVVDGPAVIAARSFLGRRADLAVTSVHHSLLGDHVRFARLASDGSRIINADVSVHLDGSGPRYAAARVRDDHPDAFTLVGERAISELDAGHAATALVVGSLGGTTISNVAVDRAALPTADRANVVRAGYRVIVTTEAPAHEWEIWVDGNGLAELRRDQLWHAGTGTAYVYDPNPRAQTGDTTMVDNNGATSTALDAARISVTLQNLDGTGVLKGTWADAHPKTAARAQSATNQFLYDRSSLHFDEVMAYYHVDRTQTHLQALGFTDANARQIALVVDGQTADNSNYSPQTKGIIYGTGGVDDAQDADVVVHEYGHSVQDNIVPNWGNGGDEGAMGEGFGDLLAASNEPVDAAGHPLMVVRECLATWDATSYDTSTPPCLRRLDGKKHYPEAADGEVHDDGEIWSAANWDLYKALGDHDLGLKLVVESFYSLNTTATFQQWANSMVAVDTAMNGGANVAKIRKAMWNRGLDRTPLPAGTLGSITPVAVNLGPAANLANNVDQSLTIHQPGAVAIRIHYSTFSMQTKNTCFQQHCDNVYLTDAAGQLFQIEGGNLGAHDSVVVPGDTVVVRWVTDASGMSPGFHIDRYDYDANGVVVVDAPPDAAVVTVDAASTPIDASPADGGTVDAPTNAATPDAGDGGAAAGGCCAVDGGLGDAGGGVLTLGLVAIARQLRRRRRIQA